MSRAIKFRGQRIDTKKWHYGDLIHEGYDVFNQIFLPVSIKEAMYVPIEVIPETVGQFTGLHDKNGKEIYEGDWLRIAAGYTSKVEFQDGMFVSVYSHPEDGETLSLIDIISDKLIVIGNIHDNNS